MAKLKKTKKQKQSKAATPSSRFNDALQRYARIQKQNDRFREEIDALYERAMASIEADEIRRVEALKLVTLRLITHLSKKTLAAYLRDALTDWIDENINEIECNPFSQHVALDELYNKLEEASNKIQKAELEKHLKKMKKQGFDEQEVQEASETFEKLDACETFEEFMQACDELFGEEDIEAADDSEQLEAAMDDMFGYEDDEFEDMGFDPGEYDDDPEEPASQQELQEQQLNNLLKKTTLTKLFRRIAKVLHPDLEQDEDKKAEKHIKMSQLIEARDQKDVAMIFQLYSETFGEAPKDLPSEDLANLTKAINIKIELIREEKYNVLHESPDKAVMYEWFYSKTPKQEAQKLNSHCKFINKQVLGYETLAKEISSLQKLRPYLIERNSQQMIKHISDDYDEIPF